jgi:hypothetical protein
VAFKTTDHKYDLEDLFEQTPVFHVPPISFNKLSNRDVNQEQIPDNSQKAKEEKIRK